MIATAFQEIEPFWMTKTVRRSDRGSQMGVIFECCCTLNSDYFRGFQPGRLWLARFRGEQSTKNPDEFEYQILIEDGQAMAEVNRQFLDEFNTASGPYGFGDFGRALDGFELLETKSGIK